MSKRVKAKVGDLVIMNALTLTKKSAPTVIRYLDTSSLTDNQFSAYQTFRYEEAPSRARRLTKQGDILYSTVRPNQKHYGFLKHPQVENMVVSTGFAVIEPDKSHIDPEYLYYWLVQEENTQKLQKVADLAVTSYPSITPADIEALVIEYPEDISEQQKIVQVLACLDAKLDHNKKLIDMLEAYIQQVFDYWFMQFDFPDESGRAYRSSGGEMVWNDILKQDIPKGWDVAPLNVYLADTSIGDWGKDEPMGNYTQRVYCIRGTDIISVDDLPVRYILKNHSHKFLLPNDIVIEVSGGSPIQATGRSTFISAPTLARYDSPLICANFCQVLRQKDDAYAGYFYRMWNKFYNAGIMFNYEGKTNGIKNLLVEAFCSIKWYFPPRELVVQFNAIAAPIISKLEQIKQEQKELTAQRDFLLPRMMNGQVVVE